jgi:hypothetical protein
MVNDSAIRQDYPVDLQGNFWEVSVWKTGALICFPSRIPAPAFLRC